MNENTSLINLTPHAINVVGDDGQVVQTLPKSAAPARIVVEREPVGKVGQMTFWKSVTKGIVGLPPQQIDTLFVVSLALKEAPGTTH